jgi:hypothetical protein
MVSEEEYQQVKDGHRVKRSKKGLKSWRSKFRIQIVEVESQTSIILMQADINVLHIGAIIVLSTEIDNYL